MAGGIWSEAEKPVLPGLYLNFRAAAEATVEPGVRGVVAVPVKAHWGPVGQFAEIAREQDLIDVYGADESGGATAYTVIRLALMGGARKVLAYRLADGTEAAASTTLTDDGATSAIRLDAKYPGERGNRLSVSVAPDPVDTTKKQVKVYEGTQPLFTVSVPATGIDEAVAAINQAPANKWVVATKMGDGNGTLKDVANQAFTGGASGISGVTAEHYMAFLDAVLSKDFNVLTLDGVSDSAILSSVVSWVAQARNEGKPVMAVLGGSAGDDTAADAVDRALARSAAWNHEGVVNVGVGGVLFGRAYSSAETAAWVAGLIAGQSLADSPTYVVAPFEDVTRRWVRSEQERAVQGGVLLLIHDGRRVKVLRGVNSLVAPRAGQSEAFRKIRTIRIFDAINADLQRVCADSFIGRVVNNEAGRLALIGAFKEYFRTLEAAQLIDAGWNVYLHPDYHGPNASHTPAPDEVYVRWEAKPTDVAEIIYGEILVK